MDEIFNLQVGDVDLGRPLHEANAMISFDDLIAKTKKDVKSVLKKLGIDFTDEQVHCDGSSLVVELDNPASYQNTVATLQSPEGSNALSAKMLVMMPCGGNGNGLLKLRFINVDDGHTDKTDDRELEKLMKDVNDFVSEKPEDSDLPDREKVGLSKESKDKGSETVVDTLLGEKEMTFEAVDQELARILAELATIKKENS